MSTDHKLPFLPRGLLRVRAANPEFQQLIRNADIILATDVRNPRNSCVVYHEPRPHKNDWQDEKTAEVLSVRGIFVQVPWHFLRERPGFSG